MSRDARVTLFRTLLAAIVPLALVACPPPPSGRSSPTLVITSVKEGTTPAKFLSRDLAAPTFTPPVGIEWPGFEISGPPDYLIVTLKKIALTGNFGSTDESPYTIWEGSKDLVLDGKGTLDTSSITLDVPTGTVTGVQLTFASHAKVKGSITGQQMITDATYHISSWVDVYTRADAAWDASTQTGGSTSYAHYQTGPGTAEETSISLSTDPSELIITTASSATIAAGDTPTLSILFDLSRVLRFSNGVRPGDGSDGFPQGNAFFYSFSAFPYSVAAFVGEAGTVQGYVSHYNGFENHGTNPTGIAGWMTLVFDPEGNFLSGVLLADADTAWTVSKGVITSYALSGGAAEIQYIITSGSTPFVMQGFVRQQSLADPFTPLATWEWNDSPYKAGEAYFELRLLLQ